MGPIEFDPTRDNEPFIRLPEPHSNIIVTPPRLVDGEDNVPWMNDPRIYKTLIGPPYPYTRADWDGWFPMISKPCQEYLAQYLEVEAQRKEQQETGSSEKRKWTGGLPVRIIREVDPVTGKQTFLGDLGIDRGLEFEGLTEEEKNQFKEQQLEDGDERIPWVIGYWLAASHHGRGIMPVVLGTLIHSFAVPYMNAHNIMGSYFESNTPSKRVFEKNGFVYDKLVIDAKELPESKGGGKVSYGIMRWKKQDN